MLTLLVVIGMVTSGAVAQVARTDGQVAQTDGRETFTVRQGGQCASLTPISGERSVRAFYDYRTPFEENAYTNRTGRTYSSHGTRTLQQPGTSVLFLYRGGNGTLSLVFVHGAVNNSTDGGSASFEISGLPRGGQWAVKDDQYRGPALYDVWSERPGTTQVDWTWDGGRTDGGAYAGLGDEFAVTIDPAFNRNAALFGQHYNGTVASWEVISAEGGGVQRASLDRSRPVTISTEPCTDGDG